MEDTLKTEEKDELLNLLTPLLPYKGTAWALKKELNWGSSVQCLSAQLRAAKDHLANRGVNIKRSARKDSTTGGYVWHITTTQEPKVLFDSREQPMEDTMRELDLTNEGQPSTPGLGIRFEISEEVAKAFFAVLPFLVSVKSKDLSSLTTLMEKASKLDIRKETVLDALSKPTNTSTKDSDKLLSRRKDDKKGASSKYRLRTTIAKNPDNYTLVEKP